MRSGTVLGNASMIDGMIDRIEEENGKVKTIVATGGFAKYIVYNCKKNIVYDPTLVLDGLYYIYKKNTVTKV
jgi:type III pantothenate kinase